MPDSEEEEPQAEQEEGAEEQKQPEEEDWDRSFKLEGKGVNVHTGIGDDVVFDRRIPVCVIYVCVSVCIYIYIYIYIHAYL